MLLFLTTINILHSQATYQILLTEQLITILTTKRIILHFHSLLM